ncbi:MAG: hypothetical protein SGJ21_01185 [Alphaproteobacteria bacterium]|nr:hypothetical protein [Alphaproteobacteria bacterium]
MIRKILLAAAVAAATLSPAAFAEDAKFNTKTTLLSAIWENPEAKAAFTKAFPEVAVNPQLEQGMGLSLTEIAGYVPDQMTPEKLAELEVELAKIK